MRTSLTAASLILALAAAPAFGQATGGAGSATAGGTSSPGNAAAGTTTDYATGKSNVTPPNRQNASCTPSLSDSIDSDWQGTAHSQFEYGNTACASRCG